MNEHDETVREITARRAWVCYVNPHLYDKAGFPPADCRNHKGCGYRALYTDKMAELPAKRYRLVALEDETP